MAEPSTWIKLNRNIIDWHWFKISPVTIQLFIYLIVKANYGEMLVKEMSVERGQYLTTIGAIAEELNLSRQNVKTALNHLRETGEIETENIANKLLITICNYNKYQGKGNPSRKSPEKEEKAERNQQKPAAKQNKQDTQDSVKSNAEIELKYVPQYWEMQIPRHYWGKFDSEDDYYEYAEQNREEVELWLMS